MSSTHAALLIADGPIPTTAICERLLRDAYGAVEVRTGEDLVGVDLSPRPIFISRLCHPRLAWLPEELARRGRHYVYFLDDNFYALESAYDPHHAAFFAHPVVRETLDRFLRGAARVWVMSHLLGDALRARHPGLPIAELPAPVDLDLFDRARSETSLAPDVASNVFRVGYPTTRRLNVAALLEALVTEAARRWGEKVQFEFIGWCPDALAGRANVRRLPEVAPYEAFVRTMLARGWHCAIAPLGISEFENCKTNLKFREYAAARIPGIYARTPLYAASVRDRDNGLLAGSDVADWVAAIDWLMTHPAERAHIARTARADAERLHAQAKVAARVRDTFADCWPGSA